MNNKPMKLLIVEDDVAACNDFLKCIKARNEFELISITNSDIEALKLIKLKKPDGIVLDIELNDSPSGNTDTFELISNIYEMKETYKPIIIVTTHINSQATYNYLHKRGVDIILYKEHPKYSSEHVLNKFLTLREIKAEDPISDIMINLEENETRISNCIYHELDLIGISSNLKGRQYLHDAIFYLLVDNDKSNLGVTQYLTKLHHKSGNTITNGIQNAIIHAWRVTSIEDLSIHYTARVNYETGLPTPMEFIYYYVDKIKKLI